MKTLLLLGAAAWMGAVCLGASAQSARPQNAMGTNGKSSPLGEPAAAARGRVVYHNRCEICHFSGSSAQKIGPGLKELYKRGKFGDGTKVSDASVQKWVSTGSENMPPFGGVLASREIHDLIAYLRSI